MKEPKIGSLGRAKDIGKKGHERYIWSSCPSCSKERWVVITKNKKPETQLCKHCGIVSFNKTRQGHRSPMWKGGRRISNGYIMVYVPDGHRFSAMRVGGTKDGLYRRYIAEHRLVMANHIDRILTREEIVHHKDGDRGNNNISNLELTALGQHAKDHGKGYEHGFEQGYAAGLLLTKRR